MPSRSALCLWTTNAALHGLTNVAPDRYQPLRLEELITTNWTITSVADMADNGLIVGMGHTNGGQDTAVLLVPRVRFLPVDAAAVNRGYDPPLGWLDVTTNAAGAEVHDDLDTPYYTSIERVGTNRLLSASLPFDNLAPYIHLELASNSTGHLSLVGGFLTGTNTPFILKAHAPGLTNLETVTLNAVWNGTTNVVGTLNVDVMPQEDRVLKVNFFYVSDTNSPASRVRIGPSLYGKINPYKLLPIVNSNFAQAHLRFELGTISSPHVPYDANTNGMYDNNHLGQLGAEEVTLLESTPLVAADINVIVVWSIKEFSNVIAYHQVIKKAGANIQTIVVHYRCAVQYSVAGNSLTAAHEIGHAIVLSSRWSEWVGTGGGGGNDTMMGPILLERRA